MSKLIPEPFFPCDGGDGMCAEEVSWPAEELRWDEEGKRWLCENCADDELDKPELGVSLLEEIQRRMGRKSWPWEGS